MRFKIDWANLIIGSEFTVFALFFFEFEGNFPSTNPRGGLIFGGAILEGFTLRGAYFRNLTVLSKSGAASVQVYPLLSLHNRFSYF